MQKYNGRVIHQIHDDDGIVEVVEAEGIRSLHFGSDSKQSSILLKNRNFLCLSYVRAMMAWHLYRENFENALLIGLGGGSLAKYLLQQFSTGHITAVEQRPSVVKIARSFFDLAFDARLKIITGEGSLYVRNAALAEQQFDLLFVDAFAHHAMSSTISGSAFFDACRQILSDHGIMIINLWDTDKVLFEQLALTMSQSFNDQLLFLSVKDRGNMIVFCFAGPLPNIPFKRLRNRAQQIESVSGIEYSFFARCLKKHNPHFLKQLKRL